MGQGAHNLRVYTKYLETRMCLYLGLPPFYKKKEKQRLNGNNTAKVVVLNLWVATPMDHVRYLSYWIFMIHNSSKITVMK